MGQAIAFRVARHHLDQRAARRDILKVTGDMGGVQAQLMNAAYMSLWARTEDLMPEDIEDALVKTRTLVKTWAMRGTVHLLPAGDLMVYLKGLSRAGLHGHAQWLARRGVDRQTVERIVNAISRALARGPLTRRELSDEVRTRLGTQMARFVESPWGDVVKDACARGVVCFGPTRGQEITFVLLDQWIPAGHRRQLSTDEAEEALLRRYLKSFGPASLTDFVHWSGIQVAEARPILERIKGDVVEADVDGRPGLILKEDVAMLRAVKPRSSVRLLPNFDAYLLGHRDKSHLVESAYYKLVYRKAGWISQTVLVDGCVRGTWAHKRAGRRLLIHVQPFAKFSKVVGQRIEGEATDLARFLGLQTAEIQRRSSVR